ncbi:MAG: glycosyltransferase family 77 protein [Proteobacteria bacterium]|jgi:hypothetical protein|nr:glycosyltransferase family 77 protein [Pseudomonadota bacterium]
MFRVIAFYTKDTPYESEVKNLEASLIKFDIPYFIQGKENRGSWVENCAIKPEFIRDMLDKFPTEDLLYLDADAVVIKPLKYVLEGNIGVHLYRGKELLSGTIFLKNTDETRRLIFAWLDRQQLSPGIWDQKVLQQVIKELGFKVDNIPLGYVKMLGRDDNTSDIYIQQNQASRRFKNLINGKEALKSVSKEEIKGTYGGVKIRWLADGSFFLARCKRETAAILDLQFIRVGKQFRWIPMQATSFFIILKPFFNHKEVYIIGKGPSLDELVEDDFPDSETPIICLNESIHKIETLNISNPLFVMQQDVGIKDSCLPKRGTMIVSTQAKNFYTNKGLGDRLFVFSPFALRLQEATLTVRCAIALARTLGSNKIVFYGCDASMKVGAFDYAKCIGYKSTRGGRVERFAKHKQIILKDVKGLPSEFRWPKKHVA